MFTLRIHKDALALKILASHKIITVKPVRRVQFSQDASQAAAHAIGKHAKIAGLMEGVEDVEKAVWWAPLDDGLQEGTNVCPYSGETEGTTALLRFFAVPRFGMGFPIVFISRNAKPCWSKLLA